MSRVAPIVPADTDLLCEGCGYTLNGLTDDSNCPECGRPIASSVGDRRSVPSWEQPAQPHAVARFVRTSADVLFRPTAFYRTLATRGRIERVRLFARIYWILASLLFSAAASIHVLIFSTVGNQTLWYRLLSRAWGTALMVIVVYFALSATTHLAAYLTAWEAAYRGLRLPRQVVLRGMFYHAAHYLPVALLALVTVIAYQLMVRIGWTDLTTVTTYLYLLCAEVIIGAAYLFHTYWIGMRNMMYANR